MDYSSISCPQFVSFNSSDDDGISDDSYFDTVHEDVCSPVFRSVVNLDGTFDGEQQGSNDNDSVFATPRTRVSGSLSQSILTNDNEDTLCNGSMDENSNDESEEDAHQHEANSVREMHFRDGPIRRERHKSWPSKTYNLRFTPSRWQHYQKLINHDVEGSVKAAMRTPFSHILRQTPKDRVSESGRKSLKTSANSPFLRRKTVGFNKKSPFTPRLARESECETSKKRKVHFSENIESPVKTPSQSFDLKKKAQVTPYAMRKHVENGDTNVPCEEEPVSLEQTPAHFFKVERRLRVTPCALRSLCKKQQKSSGLHGTWQPVSRAGKEIVSSRSIFTSKQQPTKLATTGKVVLRNVLKHPQTDSKVFSKESQVAKNYSSVASKLHYKEKTHKRATTPQPFHFKLDERIRNSGKDGPEVKKRDFVSNLRHNTPKPETKRPKMTVVQPFKLTEPVKRKRDDVIQEYKSLAQKVEEHIKKNARDYKNEASGASSSSLCHPQSPKLLTSTRQRPVYVVSQQEKEEKELEEIRAYKFHAKPLDTRILKEASQLPQVKVKSPTKPVYVELETEKRHEKRVKLSELEDSEKDQPYVFHARKVPKSILEGPVGIKEKQVRQLTQPMSPAFALKHRSNESHRQDTPQKFIFKATEMPKTTPFKPRIEKKPPTVIEPFSFSEKDIQRMKEKEKKIQEELEREKKLREFHARPIPGPVLEGKKTGIPSRLKKSVTKPKEFSFCTEKALEKKSLKKNSESENEKPFIFKAEPPKVLKKAPFKPKKPEKRILAPSDFQLSTEKRFEERKKYEERKQRLEAEQNELLHQRQLEKQKKLEEELKMLRAQTVHKAQPVPSFKPVLPKQSEKPLTMPISPKFATERRLMNKTGNGGNSKPL